MLVDGQAFLLGVGPRSIPDYLALVGDAADGYPGLAGFGAATIVGRDFITSHGGTNMSDFSNSVVGTRKGWLTPIEFDPNEAHAVYTGSEIVSRSTDDGKTWTPISPDLSREAPPMLTLTTPR